LKARSKRGALGWAIADGYEVWIFMVLVTFGLWVRQANNLDTFAAFGVLLGTLLLAALIVRWTRPWVAKQIMRMLGA
jgi:hypothetical protein